MRLHSRLLLLGTTLFFLGTTASSAMAKSAGYCLECHSRKEIDRLAIPEDLSIYQAKLDPCPGVRSISEEIFFTENRMVKMDQILQSMNGEGRTIDILKRKISETGESFMDLKGSEKKSVVQFSQESSLLRASLQKVYDRILKVRDESDRRWLIGLGSLILLALFVLLGIGFKKLEQMRRILLLALLIGGTLTWTACSFRSEQPVEKSSAQERLEQSLSVATKSTTKMEESFYQSILLAETAKDWSKIEPNPAGKGFELAWHIALKAREKAGQLRSLWPDEAEPSKQKVNFDTLLDLRDELRNAEGRTWALREIAEEWIKIDKTKGRIALEYATRETLAMRGGEVRDRELKSIAEAWAGMDENRALEMARSINDPFLKALALTNLVRSVTDEEKARSLFLEMWKTAESIPPSYLRAKAFIQISASAAKIDPQKRKEWAEKICGQIQSVNDPRLQAFAMQEMIFQWSSVDREQAERWATQISSLFPEARAYSFLHLAKNTRLPRAKALRLLKNSLLETIKVVDPFEALKIKALIVKGLVKLEPQEALRILPQVQDPFYRSEVLAQLAIRFSHIDKREGLKLAEKIPLEDIRTKVIVDIINLWMEQDRDEVSSLYAQSLPMASSISDPYTRTLILIDLGKNWGRWMRGREGAVLNLALESAGQISSPSRKAEVLEALAEAWKKSDQAKAETILNRIDPSLTHVRKSLEEIRLWSKIDPMKAFQWAEALSSDFPLEKAVAFKEVAAGMKKAQPSLALNIFEKGLVTTLTLPEGLQQSKLLSELIREAALLDREKTFRGLLQVGDREMRDFLLREAGMALIKEDSFWAMRAANEISEGSLRLALYQKIADGMSNRRRLTQPEQLALSQWGIGRKKAKKDESQAVPHYEKTLHEIERVTDRRERSHLLSGLAAEWAPINEEKALQVAKKISSEFSEPFSYALLQVGSQLRKWNRREAQSVFQGAFTSATQIQDPSLRVQRLLQLAHQWETLDREKAKEVLKRAESEALKNLSLHDKGEKILAENYLAQVNLEPDRVLTVAQNARTPHLKAKILLERAKDLNRVSSEENVNALEKSLQFAKTSKNPRMMSEIAVAWFALEPNKGLDILAQVEPKEIRISTLRRMARQSNSLRTRLLEEATQETLGIDGLNEKIKFLKEVASDWMEIDKEKAKSVYHMIYRIVEKAAL
jgi:hypothetical protein